MRSLIRSCVQVLAFEVLISALGVSQQEPQLARLTIALAKKEYFLGETVFVTYRLTNISSSLLCLPPPSVDCYSISGELAATATPPKGVVGPKSSGGCAADRWMEGDAGNDIDQHWIKLGPLQFYEITAESHYIGLIAPGRWTVGGGYVPIREDTLSLYRDALKERGCSTVPELHSETVAITAKGKLVK